MGTTVRLRSTCTTRRHACACARRASCRARPAGATSASAMCRRSRARDVRTACHLSALRVSRVRRWQSTRRRMSCNTRMTPPATSSRFSASNPAPITIAGFAPTAGPIGTVVAITGTGFSPTAANERRHVQRRGRHRRRGNGHALTADGAGGRGHGQDRGDGWRQHRDQRAGFRRRRGGHADDRRIHAGGGPIRHRRDRHRNELQRRAGRDDGQVESECRDLLVGDGDAARVRGSGLPPAPAGSASRRSRAAPSAPPISSCRRRRSPRPTSSPRRGWSRTAPRRASALYATGKFGAVLFDGNAGDWLSLQVGNLTVNPAGATIAYTIYKPDNTPARERHAVVRESLDSFAGVAAWPAPTRCCSARASRRFRSTRGSRSTPSSRPTGRHWPSRGAPGNPRAR